MFPFLCNRCTLYSIMHCSIFLSVYYELNQPAFSKWYIMNVVTGLSWARKLLVCSRDRLGSLDNHFFTFGIWENFIIAVGEWNSIYLKRYGSPKRFELETSKKMLSILYNALSNNHTLLKLSVPSGEYFSNFNESHWRDFLYVL